MKKALSLLLCAVLVIAMCTMFTGCSSNKEDITGKWVANVDMTEVLNEYILGADETMGEYIKFSDFTLKINLELGKDGIYKMYADEDSAKKAFDVLKVDFKNGMTKYLEAYIAQIDASITIQDVLDSMGTTMDELVDTALSDAILDSMVDEMYSEGQYKAEGGKFYTSEDVDTPVPSQNAEKYVLDGNNLTITGVDESADMYDIIYPLNFKRVG